MFYKAAPCLFIGRLEIEVRYKVENRDSGKPHSDVAGAGWGTGFSECCNEFGDEAIGACVTIFVGRIEYDRALELITDIWEFVQVLAWNLPDTMRMSVGIVHSAGIGPYLLHDFHTSSITTLFLPAERLVQLYNPFVLCQQGGG